MTLSAVKSILTPFKIALAVALISSWGLAGAAYSALLVEAVALAWLGAKSQALYRIPIEYGKISVIVFAAGALFVALDGNSYVGFGPADFIREHVFSPLVAFLQGTSLGEWKSGKLVQLFREKQDEAIRAMLNAVFCLSFLTLFPLLRGRRASGSNASSTAGSPFCQSKEP